jgi:hypothetical protein
MQALKDAGVAPEWVQIGNEINPGMMLPLGSITNPSNLVQLIQAGSSAAKSVFPGIKVVIHVAQACEIYIFRSFGCNSRRIYRCNICLAAFDYQLNVGGEKISKFTTPVQLSMKLDSANIKPGITAVYYLDDNNKLNFVGGKCSTGEIVVDVTHFSKYVAMNLTKTFSDVSNDNWLNDPANNYLAKGVARLIANGDSRGYFNPENTITRAEFAAFIARTLKLDTKDYEGLFTDVKADAWYAKEVEAVKRAGIIDGIGNSNFAPDKAITREEMAKMIMTAYTKLTSKSSDDLISGISSSFTDTNDVHNWAQKYVAALEKLGIISGYDGKYKPLDNSTRAQSLKVIIELAEKAGI